MGLLLRVDVIFDDLLQLQVGLSRTAICDVTRDTSDVRLASKKTSPVDGEVLFGD